MVEARTRLVPWQVLVTMIALALGVVVIRHGFHLPDLASWIKTGPLLVSALAAFLIERWMQGWLWGIVTASLLVFHPESVRATDEAFLAEALELLSFSTVTAAWILLFQPYFSWKGWSIVAAMVTLSLALTWPLSPPTALANCGLVILGLVIGLCLAMIRRKRQNLANINLIIAAGIVLLAPVLSLVLALMIYRKGLNTDEVTIFLRAMIPENFFWKGNQDLLSSLKVDVWTWPWPWLILPLIVDRKSVV